MHTKDPYLFACLDKGLLRRKVIMLKYRLKVKEKDGTVKLVATTKKMKVWSNLVGDSASEWKLEVVYQPGVTNSGTYHRLKDVKDALSAFTEKPLLEFVKGGTW